MTNPPPGPVRPRPYRLLVDLRAVRARHWAILRTRTRQEFHAALIASVKDIPLLVSEVDGLWLAPARMRRRYADLLAAARAAVSAEQDGEDDPLYYVRDELAAHSWDWR
jgi:hypothetical protein